MTFTFDEAKQLKRKVMKPVWWLCLTHLLGFVVKQARCIEWSLEKNKEGYCRASRVAEQQLESWKVMYCCINRSQNQAAVGDIRCQQFEAEYITPDRK